MYTLMTELTAIITQHGGQHPRYGGRHQGDARQSRPISTNFFRPLRNYLYWEPHCFDILGLPVDAVLFRHSGRHRQLTDKMQTLTTYMDRMDQLMPQMPPELRSTIDSMKRMRDFMIATHSTQAVTQAAQQEAAKGAIEIGLYFDQA